MSSREHAQLPLIAVDGAADNAFIDLLKDVVDANGGMKVVAGELDIQPSQLSNAFAGKNYNHVWAEHVPWLISHDKSLAALRYLADMCGMDLVPQRKLSDAEELAALKETLAESLTQDIATMLLAKASRKARGR